jgi:hypothetical protein
VEVDVAVRYQQSRAERADQMRFGAHGTPDAFDAAVADDLLGALLVRGGEGAEFVHCAML